MFRPRTFSATARTGTNIEIIHTVDTPLLSILSNPSSRNRAVDNDYSDHPSAFRPASAPLVTSVLSGTREPPRHREHLLGRDVDETRMHDADRSRHSRNHRDPLRSRRHRMPLPLPGSAARITEGTTSLPPSLISREPPKPNCHNQTSSAFRPTPVVPPRVYPSTVGHLPPRRTLSEDLSHTRHVDRAPPPIPVSFTESTVVFTPTDPSTPPPRPPPPQPEVAVRLGLIAEVPRDNHSDAMVPVPIPVCTSQPVRRNSRDTGMQGVVLSQPSRLAQPAPAKSDSISKKALVVELNEDQSTKTRTSRDSRTPASKNDSSLKKNVERESHNHTDSDHEIMGPGSGADHSAKPGEHNYPCPRCGKCMCPRCRGDLPGTAEAARRAATQCWVCDNRFNCTADTFVETATCLCCVRGCFYHCSNYEDNAACTDKPCSCRASNWCCRWTAIGALSLLLPCLLCYPVAQGCLHMCRSCAKCVKPGCRCKEAYR